MRFSHAGNVLTRMGNRYAGPGSPIGMYRASDGWIAFTVATAEHGQTLLDVTGLTHLLDLPGVTSVTDVMIDASILDLALNGWLAERTVEEAVDLLQAVRLAVAPVLSMQALLKDPQLAAREWWRMTEVDGQSVTIPGPPFRIDDWEWNACAAPGPGSVRCCSCPAFECVGCGVVGRHRAIGRHPRPRPHTRLGRTTRRPLAGRARRRCRDGGSPVGPHAP